MESSNNVSLHWLPGLGIIQNMSWIIKSHLADARWLTVRKVCPWGIQLLNHSIIEETSIYTRTCWRTRILMLSIIQVSAKSVTSSGNTISAISIAFGSLMNCINCSWYQLNSYCTGSSNTKQLGMFRINVRIDSHSCHNIPASSTSLTNSIQWKLPPAEIQRYVEGSEHWQQTLVQFLLSTSRTGKLEYTVVWARVVKCVHAYANECPWYAVRRHVAST